MSELSFGINIEDCSDCSNVTEESAKNQTDKVTLYDWQRRGMEFFFKNNHTALYEVVTGCLTGDTLIEMPRNLTKYPKGIPIKDLVNKKDFYVYTFNIKKQIIELKQVKKVFKTGYKDVYEIITSLGKKIKATSNHPFLVDIKEKPGIGAGRGSREKIIDRKYINVEDLKIGQYLTTWNRNWKYCEDGHLLKVDYNNTRAKRCLEHRFIIAQIEGLKKCNVVHHEDENKDNNSVDNLTQIDNIKHASYHTKKRGFYGKELWAKNGHPKGMKGKIHTDKTKSIIATNTSLAKNGSNYISYRKNRYNNEFTDKGYKLFTADYYGKDFSNNIKKGLKNSTKLSERSKQYSKTRYSEKIISIKHIGKEDVYDMEVPGNNNFIANGFVVHNSGKTFFTIQLIKKILKTDPELRVLIVVPKNVILEKTWYPEFYDAGFKIQDIGVYYGAVKEYAKFTITNMQNIDKVELGIFDMICFDEVHNFTTKRLMKYVKIPFKYKLGLSATIDKTNERSWDLIKVFNYNIFKYEPKQALLEGVLNPFDFYNYEVVMDDDARAKYNDVTQRINVVLMQGGSFYKIMRTNSPLKMKLMKLLDERKKLVLNYYKKFDVVKLICQKHKNDKIIIFNEYNDTTNKLYWHLLDIGLKAKVLHSAVSGRDREQILIDYKHDKFNILLTTKMLDEGYNLPKIDTAIIMAGNSTPKQAIQRMGRVLRKKEKKSTLWQVYCQDTMEADQSMQRAKMFKSLCEEHDMWVYD